MASLVTTYCSHTSRSLIIARWFIHTTLFHFWGNVWSHNNCLTVFRVRLGFWKLFIFLAYMTHRQLGFQVATHDQNDTSTLQLMFHMYFKIVQIIISIYIKWWLKYVEYPHSRKGANLSSCKLSIVGSQGNVEY